MSSYNRGGGGFPYCSEWLFALFSLASCSSAGAGTWFSNLPGQEGPGDEGGFGYNGSNLALWGVDT